MFDSSYLMLIYNSALLLTMVLLFNTFSVHWQSWKISLKEILLGLIAGIIGIIIIHTALELEEGVFFDSRSVLLSISGLFFSPVITVIAVIVTSIFRIYLGGAGAFTGVLIIITTSSVGLLWKKIYKK
ncbi:MAG: LytS/YhcK type 5TM receptor domain-containing protein, partial [Candidatus Cloacimonetes bacterium]|nr:LytS/YhcK type 5TM receptor domain-containing protein [Candidatus Cloacimonadota bacterium]